MCISKGTYSSGKHFMVHESKKVKGTERESEKQPVSERWFTVAFRVWQPGFAQHPLQGRQEPPAAAPPGDRPAQGTAPPLRPWPEQVQTPATSRKACRKQLNPKNSPGSPADASHHSRCRGFRGLLCAVSRAARTMPIPLPASSKDRSLGVASNLCLSFTYSRESEALSPLLFKRKTFACQASFCLPALLGSQPWHRHKNIIQKVEVYGIE